MACSGASSPLPRSLGPALTPSPSKLDCPHWHTPLRVKLLLDADSSILNYRCVSSCCLRVLLPF